MHSSIKSMLAHYKCQTPTEYKNALKEIMQEIALLGLSRQNFFHYASFYGGTALRIAHGLGRFSEDMDFTLCAPDPTFDIRQYLQGIEDEFLAFGLKLVTEKKDKISGTGIDSAFLKANTLEHLLIIEGLKTKGTHKNEMIKIKLEIDTDPPLPTGQREVLFHLRPIPFNYQILTLPTLFGGKLHVLLSRKYKGGRVKGRDYYDFIWYASKGISPDLFYLKGKLCESGVWEAKNDFTISDLKVLLKKKFESTDWQLAKKDVAPFIRDNRELDVWSIPFFMSLINSLNPQ